MYRNALDKVREDLETRVSVLPSPDWDSVFERGLRIRRRIRRRRRILVLAVASCLSLSLGFALGRGVRESTEMRELVAEEQRYFLSELFSRELFRDVEYSPMKAYYSEEGR